MPLTANEKLRRYLGDKIEDGQTEADKFFTDAEIQDLIDEYPNDLFAAAADGWAQKASKFADLIDIDESGSNRKLTQRYRQAVERGRYFAQKVLDSASASQSGFRAVAKVASLDETANAFLGPYNWPDEFGDFSETIVTYPTFRMGGMKTR